MDDKQVEREIQETLDLLAVTPRVKPTPFFYTRLKARMAAAARPERGLSRLLHTRAVLAVVAVALLVALNAFSLLQLASRSSEAYKQEAAASIAQDYSISYNPY
jgi:hypothetical protein